MDIDFTKVDTFHKYLELRNGLHSKTGKIRKILSCFEGKCFGVDVRKSGWANDNFPITEKQARLAWKSKVRVARGSKIKFTKQIDMEIRIERNTLKDFDKKFLYLMKAMDYYYKIGVSDNPNKRLLALQTGCPSRISIQAVWEVKDAYLAETHLHKKFAKFNSHSEWFLFPRQIDICNFEKNFDFEFRRAYDASVGLSVLPPELI